MVKTSWHAFSLETRHNTKDLVIKTSFRHKKQKLIENQENQLFLSFAYPLGVQTEMGVM